MTDLRIIRRVSFVLAGCVLAAPTPAQTSDEYRVKAAFLYNFTKFVEWPPQAFRSPSAQIVIGVLGKDPFGSSLVMAVEGKTVNGRSFQVREIGDAAKAGGCQILFISASERRHLPEVLGEVGNPGVLTVGETDDFAADGGVINFKIQDGSVHLQVNLQAAQRQQLRISAKLLSLAEITRN